MPNKPNQAAFSIVVEPAKEVVSVEQIIAVIRRLEREMCEMGPWKQ